MVNLWGLKKIYCPNTKHRDDDRSAVIDVESSRWQCFECGGRGQIVPDGTEGAYQHPSTRQDKAAHVASSHLRCDDAHCNICVGGLFCCIRCGSAEGATTSECPGVRMTADQADAVHGGKLDYRAGEWREEPSRYSPSGFASYMEALKSGKAWEQKEPGVPFMIEDMGMCPPGQFFFHAVPCTCKKGN